MDKNKAFSDMERAILLFYGEMKWILNSNRGKKFQFMMLSRTLEAILHILGEIRAKYGEKTDELPKSPLDT